MSWTYCLCIEQAARPAVTSDDRCMEMANELSPEAEPAERMVYQIRIKGHLSSQWTAWFGGLAITLEENGDTILTGPVPDQAALHGLLRKVRDLGMPLLSVNRVEPAGTDAPDVKPPHPGQ